MIANTNPDLKKRVGWLAYVDAGLRAIPASKPFRVAHRLDTGRHHRSRVSSILVANLGYLPGNIELIPDAEIDDGKLDVVVLQPRNVIGWLFIWRKVTWENRVLRKSVHRPPVPRPHGRQPEARDRLLARTRRATRHRGRPRGVRDRRRRVRLGRLGGVPGRPGGAHRARREVGRQATSVPGHRSTAAGSACEPVHVGSTGRRPDDADAEQRDHRREHRPRGQRLGDAVDCASARAAPRSGRPRSSSPAGRRAHPSPSSARGCRAAPVRRARRRRDCGADGRSRGVLDDGRRRSRPAAPVVRACRTPVHTSIATRPSRPPCTSAGAIVQPAYCSHRSLELPTP